MAFNPRVGNIPWRRAWQPPPVFLPGESCGESPAGSQRWTWLEWHGALYTPLRRSRLTSRLSSSVTYSVVFNTPSSTLFAYRVLVSYFWCIPLWLWFMCCFKWKHVTPGLAPHPPFSAQGWWTGLQSHARESWWGLSLQSRERVHYDPSRDCDTKENDLHFFSGQSNSSERI